MVLYIISIVDPAENRVPVVNTLSCHLSENYLYTVDNFCQPCNDNLASGNCIKHGHSRVNYRTPTALAHEACMKDFTDMPALPDMYWLP